MLELQQQHPHFLFNPQHDHIHKAPAPAVTYLPSPPSDQSVSEHDSPSPPATLSYPTYDASAQTFQQTYEQYDNSNYSASPPITPTDDQPFPAHYPSTTTSSSMRRLSDPAFLPPLAPPEDAYTHSAHQYSPRPSHSYAYPNRHSQWDNDPSAYQSDGGPLTTQPLASTSTAQQQQAQLQSSQSQQTLPPIASLGAGMQTATGAIISVHHVQTALPGVPVEVAGGLPTHPPVPVPPLAGPASPPVLPGMANHPTRLKQDGRRASLTGPGAAGGRDERDKERGVRDREGKESPGGAGEGKDGKGKSSKQYAFVELPGNAVKKRPRRRYDEIERLYRCNYPSCAKAYGTLNHLNAHVTMQKHGAKRSPGEFKELRKQWRLQKKEADEAERDRERQERLGLTAIPTHQHPHVHTQNSGMQQYGIYHPVPPVNAGIPAGMSAMGAMGMGVPVGMSMGMTGMQATPYGYMQQQQPRAGEYYGSQRDSQPQYAHARDYAWADYSPSSQPQAIPPQTQSQAQAQCNEYEDYSTIAAPRRGSMAGVPYPLSPVSLYSTTSGRSSISSAPGATDEGFSPIPSYQQHPHQHSHRHPQEQRHQGEYELDYPTYDTEYRASASAPAQSWHPSHGQAPAPGHAHSMSLASVTTPTAAYASPPTASWDLEQAQEDADARGGEPLLASHVSLGSSNRLPPDSTLLTPYVPPAAHDGGV